MVASYYLLGSVLFLLVLVVALLQPAFVSALHNPNLRQDIQDAGKYQGIHALLIVIFAGIGVGLWFLQPWARTLVLVITGIDVIRRAITFAIYLLPLATGSHRALGAFFWFATVMDTSIFAYMRLGLVKRAFKF